MPRIAEGLQRLGTDLVNCYLVEDTTGLTVVDAGLPSFYDKLAATLRESGRTWEDIRALVLTHAHFDHVGFAERLRSEHGVPVLVHAADEQLARTQKVGSTDGSMLSYLRYPAAWRLLGLMATAGLPKRVRIADVQTFGGGEQLDVPGRPRVIHAPGHTEGCVALHFEGHGALLVGDVLCSRNPLTGKSGVQVMPAAFAASADQALESLANLEGVDAAVVAFGHGDPWRGGVREAVAEARATGKT